MGRLELYIPKIEDYWYEEKIQSDPKTMSYNAGWDVSYVEGSLDINGDCKITNRDATRLLQYLAGWDVDVS